MMGSISTGDRKILQELAKKQVEYANSPENAVILQKWDALAAGKRETPTVRLLFSNFQHEVITPRLRCEGEQARAIEADMLRTLAGRELFGDDTPIAAEYKIGWHTWVQPFGAKNHITRASNNSMGFHIDPIIDDLKKDFSLLEGGTFGVDKERTKHQMAFVQDVLGDILNVKITMGSLPGSLTNPLVHLMGMENYYCAMYDYPEELHKAMDMATTIYENYYDFLATEGLLLPTSGDSSIGQESFAFNNELPTEDVTKTTQCWGFLESQETTAVSPETFGTFVYPYQDRLVKRFGLLSYGCCERIDTIWPDYLSKWKNLRKLSVPPFNDEKKVGGYLRHTNVVYYSKPRAEYVTNPGPLDEDALRDYFKEVCECASGCLFEMAQREVGTIFGDYNRGHRYVEIAKECIERYWKP